MDLIRERMLMSNRKGSDVDMSTWEKVAEISDVASEQRVNLSKPCTEIIVVGEGIKALRTGQIFMMINNTIHINGSNDNFNTDNPTFYIAKLKICGYGIVVEMRGSMYSLTTFDRQLTAIIKADITEITSVEMIASNSGNAFKSGKFEFWGR